MSNSFSLPIVREVTNAYVQGKFRSTQPDPESIFCATKYCIFQPIAITKEFVEENIAQRVKRINRVGLLQFHWQDVNYLVPLSPLNSLTISKYNGKQYVQALKFIGGYEGVKSVVFAISISKESERLQKLVLRLSRTRSSFLSLICVRSSLWLRCVQSTTSSSSPTEYW